MGVERPHSLQQPAPKAVGKPAESGTLCARLRAKKGWVSVSASSGPRTPEPNGETGPAVTTVIAPAAGQRAKRRLAPAERLKRRREEATLVAAVLDGSEDAARTLVERYQKQLYWIAHDILLDPHEARDVAQESFVRAFSALERFDPERDLVNWLCRIARNLSIDILRRRKRRAGLTDDFSYMEGEAQAAPEADLERRVREVLAELPVEYRLALTLREFHGMTPREMARVTDCSYPTARWRLHRARALFRKAWEARYGVGSFGGVA